MLETKATPASGALPFDTVLIANRGEIAIRIARSLRELGIRAVGVRASDDSSPHPEYCDAVAELGSGPLSETYLSIPRIIEAARALGAAAIHPGYGFLAENAIFAEACDEAGIVFIGPPAKAITTMGDKISARRAVEQRGVATVPGIAEPGLDDAALIEGAGRIGFPVLIKPASGGGGKGMHRVDAPGLLPAALQSARREAKAAFGDDTLFIERFVTNPRHIEVQVLADSHESVIHLGERECSLQRRHQKVIEEAPSPLLTEAQRAAIGEAAVETARSVGYVGAGTVEFIVAGDRPDEPYFMEMNTRLQVEHRVTEMVTGVDLVAEQVRIAAGGTLSLTQDDVQMRGHAIEARLYAEDPAAGFLPTGGTVSTWIEPVGAHVRVDAGIAQGTVVGPSYDPMMAKIIAHGQGRDVALRRLREALRESVVFGVRTNRAFLLSLLDEPAVRDGALDTGFIDREGARIAGNGTPSEAFAVAAASEADVLGDTAGVWRGDGWRIGGVIGRLSRFRDGEGVCHVRQVGGIFTVTRADGSVEECSVSPDSLVERASGGVWVNLDEADVLVEPAPRRARGRGKAQPTLISPMPGTVVAVHVADRVEVAEGDAIVSVEAMKMEHVLRAPTDGVARVRVGVGEQVQRGQEVAVVEGEST